MIYFAFLSEAPGIENLLAEYLCVVFERRCAQDADRAALQRKLSGWARAVEKEKTRLENSLLFVSAGRKTPECHISPKYNVLPLLSRHFRTRYGNSPWMIVDRKRNYGLYGENGKVSLVQKGWERMRNVPVNPRAAGQTERQRIRPAI
jgi:probable DNA metabolism protein